jgi:hypothetical protein
VRVSGRVPLLFLHLFVFREVPGGVLAAGMVGLGLGLVLETPGLGQGGPSRGGGRPGHQLGQEAPEKLHVALPIHTVRGYDGDQVRTVIRSRAPGSREGPCHSGPFRLCPWPAHAMNV